MTTETRCLAGKVYVAVRAQNDDDAPLTVRLDTPFGTKTVNGVEPGKNVYQSFATRASSVEAGEVTVVATDARGGRRPSPSSTTPAPAADPQRASHHRLAPVRPHGPGRDPSARRTVVRRVEPWSAEVEPRSRE